MLYLDSNIYFFIDLFGNSIRNHMRFGSYISKGSCDWRLVMLVTQVSIELLVYVPIPTHEATSAMPLHCFASHSGQMRTKRRCGTVRRFGFLARQLRHSESVLTQAASLTEQ